MVSGSVKFQDGSPLLDESVFARPISTGGNPYVTTTWTDPIKNGQYSFGNSSDYFLCPGGCPAGWDRLPPGAYQLCVADGPGGAEYCYPQTLTVDWYDDLAGIDITVPNDFGTPYEVGGRVTTPDGIGIAGATVRIEVAYVDLPDINVSTDAEGYYHINRADGLQPVAYHIYAVVDGVSHIREQDFGIIRASWRRALENIDIVVPESVHMDGY